jgi:signal transduction histidine kinase
MSKLEVFHGNRRVALDLTVGSLVTLLSLFYGIATFQVHGVILGILLSLTSILQLFSMVSLRRGTRFALYWRAFLLISADIALFAFCLWVGRTTGFYHFYLSLTALPLLFIESNHRWTVRTCVALPILLYIVLELVGSQVMLPMPEVPTLVDVLHWFLFPFRFVFLLLGAHYLSLSNQKAQARVNLTLSELRENVRTSRALLAAIPDMIFRVSDEGRFLDFHCQDVNDLFAPPEKLVGKKLAEVLPATIGSKLGEHVISVIRGGGMQVFSFELEKGGEIRHYDARMAGTGATDALLVVQDVSERVRAEKTILEQQVRAAAASKMASLGEMAAGIAHEINNPLAIISGDAQQLKEIVEGDELEKTNLGELASRVDQTAHRISKIIRSLRFFARDGQEDPFEEAPVAQIVSDTMEFCRQRFSVHAIDLRLHPISEELTIECRAVQIGQVLLNLLNNAHDAVEGLSERWIELSIADQVDWVRIAVTDSGKGIAPELHAKILEPFFTTKEVGKGTGLGLSISKGIIEAHRGKLYVDGNWPHTRFVMELPKTQRSIRQPASAFLQTTEGR